MPTQLMGGPPLPSPRRPVGEGGFAALFARTRSVSARLMLVVFFTTALALVIAGSALIVTDVRDSRRSWAEDLTTEGAILALALTPALSFHDPGAAARNLTALQARPSIHAAVLYSAEGDLYASYVRPLEAPPPARVPSLSDGIHIDGSFVELVRGIEQNGERLGTIYLRAQHDISGRVRAYAGILAVVMLVSLAVALLAGGRLQRGITEPLDSMAQVAAAVVGDRNYTLRARKTTDDEIGLVVDAFNNMLDEVQARAQALEKSNSALQEQISERLAAEQALRASEKLYRAIGESIQYGVWVSDAYGRWIYASDSFLQLLGLKQQQCSEFGWADHLHPDERDATIAAWQDCVRTGQSWYREHRIRGTDGSYHPVLSQGVAIHDENGNTTGWAGINLDISRLKATEDALREADRRKDEFLATLAHELRNPLAPIRNAVRILDIPGSAEHQRRWAREVIARQVRNMALLLDDLLDVSRITRGRLELKKQYVALRAVVDVAVETARPLIEQKRHSLSVTLPPPEITLEADPLRLSQIIANLLTNAAKYTDPAGRIALSVSLLENELLISVKDTGIGLAPETIPSLFAMFSQVHSSIDRAQGGLGIGLGLVKGLTKLHGGRVEARSDGLGFGSEFLVYLPRSMLTSAREVRESTSREELPASAAFGRVLIADDNREAADSLAALLELAGFDVCVAYCGERAVELAADRRPHVMLLDIGMPGMSGYEVARRIRREAWGRDTLLVAITGWGQEEDRNQARAAGFDEHLTKPVDPGHVEALVASFLGNTERRSAGS